MEHSGFLFVITGLSIISAIYCMYEMQKKAIKTMSVPAATLLIIAALSSYTVYTEAPKMENGDAHLNTVLEHHPLPKPVTKDRHWQGLELAYLNAPITQHQAYGHDHWQSTTVGSTLSDRPVF